jgi:hypothetical protein
MRLRGALSRDFNLVYAVAGLCIMGLIEYATFELRKEGSKDALVTAVAFAVGLIVGSPAGLMNRRALRELYTKLVGKLYLSSQIALLDSRQGKNAFAYFYFVLLLAMGGRTILPFLPESIFAPLAVGAYYSANLFPFLFSVKVEAGEGPTSGYG